MTVKARHKIIPAIAMLLVSAIALTSASYAWFTMNRAVKVEGIDLTISAPSNLLISNAVDGDYRESTTITSDFGEAKLLPASSLDGKSFFKTDKTLEANIGAPDATTKIDTTTTAIGTDTDGYFADYHVWLKTTGDKAVDIIIDAAVTAITDKTAGSPDITPAVRFAILKADGTLFAADTKNCFAFGGATYFNGLNGPITAAQGGDEEPASTNYMGTADAFLSDDGTAIFNVPAGGTPVEVIIRVWVEGQETACVNTNGGCNFGIVVGFKDMTYTG